MKNNLVTQANALIQASYSLTLNEKRLIIAAISNCDSSNELPDIIIITAKQYADLYGLSTKNAYDQIKEAADKLYEQTIDFSTQNGDQEYIGKTRWIHTKLEPKSKKLEGEVILKFNEDIKPYLSNLKNEFTSYRIRHVAALKSPYSIRLYELICQYQDLGSFWLTLDDFRRMFVIQDKYKKFSGIKQRVLDPCVKELTKKTNMVVTYKTEKKGRSVKKIYFYFNEKPQSELEFLT